MMALTRFGQTFWVAAAVIIFYWSPVYLSQAATSVEFEADTWRTLAPHEDSHSVVLGDVDLDGDLDLIFGNKNGGASLYLNSFGRLTTVSPSWVSGDTSSLTTSLALGDIDGDGFVDLVCGNEMSPVTFYRNLGGTFPLTAETLGGDLPVSDLVLADLDNDGDLDLVIGCDGLANRWWPNVDGVLRPDLAVLMGDDDLTQGIAVGDLTDDGWLDIVVVNNSANGDLHRVIVNQAGDLTVQSVAIPFVLAADKPTSVVLGDVSGDGRLDIIFGAESNRVWIYVHNGDLTFTKTFSATGAGYPTDLALHDMNADGLLDICYTTGSTTLPLNWQENLAGSWAPGVGLLVQNAEGLNALAFGDLDEDGDLDLVAASSDSTGNVVAWRQGGILEAVPSWVAQDLSTTYGLAFVDLDLDGDLDVVQGRYGAPNAIYFNADGVIPAVPENITSESTFTTSLVVTDWDDNGYPDLIFGNELEPVHLHQNMNGVLAATPILLTEFDRAAWSLAVADLDNDGHDDLIEGSPGRLRVSFRNAAETGFRQREIFGVTSNANWYNYLALADVDGDGDLDLAVALNNGPDVVYRNDFPAGGGLEIFWSSPVNRSSTFVSLVDLNGDGAVDLVFGYAETATANEWYRRDNVDFDVPGRRWGDQDSPTWQVDLTDWDGDGFLDLLEANFGGTNRLYQNKAGFIAQADRPLWTSQAGAQTYRLVAGDLDADGDLDLWVGNRDEPDQLYRGVINPGPTHPNAIAQPLLPFQTAFIQDIHLDPSVENVVGITCLAVDKEGDDLTIIARCRPAASHQWFALETHTNLATSENGIAHRLSFDSATWPSAVGGYVVQLRSLEASHRVAQFRKAPRYEIRVADAGITRPERVLSAQQILLPTLTEGGSTSAFLTVSNVGNAPLIITAVATSRSELSSPVQLPLNILPGAAFALELILAPLDTISGGSIFLATNDPRFPLDTIGVITDIRPLEFDFNFLLEGGTVLAPLGESLTGLLAPRDGVDMTEGLLHYRSPGASSFTTLPFSPVQDDWIVVLPGSDVNEAGIEYYLEVRNGQKTVTSPAADPTQSPYFMPVAAPNQLTSLVQEHSDAGILAARDIFIRVVPPAGTLVDSGAVQYRLVGDTAFQTATLQPDSTALIPAAYVGPRGLEFHVDVTTFAAQLRDPISGEHQIRVNVPDLSEPSSTPAKQYRMVSVPLDFGDFDVSIGDLVTDQPEFGPYDDTRWRCLRYVSDLGRYLELSDQGVGEVFRPAPGKAFWLIAAQENRLSTAPVVGLSLSGAQPFEVLLKPGWNQVGNPFAFATDWNQVLLTDLSGAAVVDLVSGPLTGDGSELTILPVFGGFWLKNFHDEDVLAHFQPQVAAETAQKHPTEPALVWALNITASAPELGRATLTVGAGSEAREAWDRLDRPSPPLSPNQKLSFHVFNENWARYSGRYARDIRPTLAHVFNDDERGHTWQLSLALTSLADERMATVQLEFGHVSQLPPGILAVLFDRQLQQSTVLNSGASLTVIAQTGAGDSSPARFQLVVGTEAYLRQAESALSQTLPRQTVLRQNAPNPFNPATTIRYDLAKSGQVGLKIYDVKGRRIRDLVSERQASGAYEILWNGRNNSDEPVSAGVYFARLQVGGKALPSIKMILVN